MKAVRLENLGTKTPPGKSAEEWRRKKNFWWIDTALLVLTGLP